MQQQIIYHNTTVLIHAKHSIMNPLVSDENIDGKGKLFVIKQEISNTDAQPRELE
jgi:hypothetical protein